MTDFPEPESVVTSVLPALPEFERLNKKWRRRREQQEYNRTSKRIKCSLRSRLLSLGVENNLEASEYAQWLHQHPLFQCTYCNRQVEIGDREKRAVDHIHPLNKGGRHEVRNLAPVCRRCNSKKGIKVFDFEPCLPNHLTPEAWKESLKANLSPEIV